MRASKAIDQTPIRKPTIAPRRCRPREMHETHSLGPKPNVNGGWMRRSDGNANSSSGIRNGNASGKIKLRTMLLFQNRGHLWPSKSWVGTLMIKTLQGCNLIVIILLDLLQP